MSQVPQRQFGKLALRGSVLGLGTVKWGRNQKVKYAPFDLPTEETLLRLLQNAEDCGLNVLDTAPAYGLAEERIGRLLGMRRSQWILSTKVGEEFVDGESRYDFSAEAVTRSVQRSLQRLRTDYLDIVFLHCPAEDLSAISATPALQTLGRLKEQGCVRYMGVSSTTLAGGLAAVEFVDAVMVAWNHLYREQEPVIRRAGELGRAVFLKKALLSGTLGSGDERTRQLQTCIHQALDLPEVSSIIAGTIDPDHLRENAEAASNWNASAKSQA